MPNTITVKKRSGWWWVGRRRYTTASFDVPFRTWREAYDYACTITPWPKSWNRR